jgi:hypothetical protein
MASHGVGHRSEGDAQGLEQLRSQRDLVDEASPVRASKLRSRGREPTTELRCRSGVGHEHTDEVLRVTRP